MRERLGWDSITLLADLDRVVYDGPSPYDEVADNLDGPEEQPRSRTLQLLDALPHGKVRDAVWLALLRGECPTQEELARRAGVSQPRVCRVLRAAWDRVATNPRGQVGQDDPPQSGVGRGLGPSRPKGLPLPIAGGGE